MSRNEQHSSHSRNLYVVGDGTDFGMFRDELQCCAELVSSKPRRFRTVCSPPSRGGSDLSGRKRSRFERERHDLIGLVDLCQKFVGIYELSATRLIKRLEQERLLFGRHPESLVSFPCQNSHLLSIRKGFSLDDNPPVGNCSGEDFHNDILLRFATATTDHPGFHPDGVLRLGTGCCLHHHYDL